MISLPGRFLLFIPLLFGVASAQGQKVGDDAVGTRKYDDYKTPKFWRDVLPRGFLPTVDAVNDVAIVHTPLG